MLTDDQFKEVYNRLMATVNDILEEFEDDDENIHLVTAGVLTTMGLSMYKTIMSEKDFEKMVTMMHDMKDEIKTMEPEGELMDSEKYH
tara:strand:- start:464 stop:727 length:264 start_codon:yes stop_codon:yes gene_type:complete